MFFLYIANELKLGC